MTKIIYNGKDISGMVDLKKSLLHDRAGGAADNAVLVFPDGDKIWGRWGAQRGDTLQVKYEHFDTGLLYVDSISQSAGIFTVEAISIPIESKYQKTRIWRDVRLSEIIADICSALNLSLQTYGISDFSYTAISQINETDIDFLQRICIREGYMCKISNGNLIVFSELYIESQTSEITITPQDVFPSYNFESSFNLLSDFTVIYNGEYSYTAKDKNIKGSSIRKIEYMSCLAEAQRWATGYLRSVNKYKLSAYIPMKFISNIAAGSVVTLSGFGAFDGKYYVDSVVYHTVENNSYLNLRTTLQY